MTLAEVLVELMLHFWDVQQTPGSPAMLHAEAETTCNVKASLFSLFIPKKQLHPQLQGSVCDHQANPCLPVGSCCG